MNIDINIKQMPTQLAAALSKLKRHFVFIFIITVLGIYGFLIFQINRLSTSEPTQEKISEQLNNVPRPKIDQDSVDKLEQLQDQNVRVQTLFKSARDNPFSE